MKKEGKKASAKKLTIDDLALMTQRGFDSLHGEIKQVSSDLHEEVNGLRTEVKGLRTEMNERFDIIEHKLIAAHDRRLDKVEDDVRFIKTLLEKKLSASFPR